jgi:hypothetical protein
MRLAPTRRVKWVLLRWLMHRRFLTTLLLVLALAAGSLVPARARQADAQKNEAQLSAEEEREAVELAERFMKGFEEKNDSLSLIDEMYVRDFDTRLRRDPNPFIYLIKVEPQVTAKVGQGELRRLYAASLNFIYATGFLYGLNYYHRKLKGIEEGDHDPPLRELMPPGVLEVLKSDPLMAELIAEDEENERERTPEQPSETEQEANEGQEKKERTTGPEISSPERLRSFLSTLERAATLLREHLKTIQGPHNWKGLLAALETVGAPDEKEDGCKGLCPRSHTLSDEFFGSPTGTRLICINVMAFHMDLIRVEGRLRILNVYLMDD